MPRVPVANAGGTGSLPVDDAVILMVAGDTVNGCLPHQCATRRALDADGVGRVHSDAARGQELRLEPRRLVGVAVMPADPLSSSPGSSIFSHPRRSAVTTAWVR